MEKSTLFHFGQVDLCEVLMLGLCQFVHAIDVLNIPVIALDERLLVIHDIFVGRVLEPKDLNGTEMRVVNVLYKLQLL
jgi:hypothetical protein